MSHYTSLAIDNSNLGSSKAQRDTQQGVKTLSLTSIAAVEEIHGDKTKAISVWLALLINIIIICILSTAVFVPFKLTTFGLLSSRTKSIYVTGLTVLATICAAFSSTQIRHLWLRKIDVQLATPGIDFSAVNTRIDEMENRTWGIKRLGRITTMAHYLLFPDFRSHHDSHRGRVIVYSSSETR
jgi:hypothetical protein